MSEQVQEGHDNEKKKDNSLAFSCRFYSTTQIALCTHVTEAANGLGKQQCYVKIISHI